MGDGFTEQKTQPTVSKYWRKRRYKSEENPENANNTKYSYTINRQTENPPVWWVGSTTGSASDKQSRPANVVCITVLKVTAWGKLSAVNTPSSELQEVRV